MAGKRLVAGLCSCLLTMATATHAQLTRDSATRAAAIARAVKEYRSFISVSAPLYLGPKYTPYTHLVEKGQPFFLNTSFHPGTILYDGILYDRVQLKYDELTHRVVIADPQGISEICPDPDKIEAFRILDHPFIKLTRQPGVRNAPSPGYYEVLYAGNGVTVLKREDKVLRQSLDGAIVSRYILTSSDYYLKKGDTYYPVNKKSQLVELLKDHKKEVQEYLRKRELDFDDDKDNAIRSTLQYYDSLLKS